MLFVSSIAVHANAVTYGRQARHRACTPTPRPTVGATQPPLAARAAAPQLDGGGGDPPPPSSAATSPPTASAAWIARRRSTPTARRRRFVRAYVAQLAPGGHALRQWLHT